jgi:hypothetical protein
MADCWRFWWQHSTHFFWKHEKLAVGLWRWSLFLLLTLCIAEFVWKSSWLFTTKFINVNVYSHGRGKISDLMNNKQFLLQSFRTGRLERELQMVLFSATRCSCIAILWVSLVSFAIITLCVASQRVFIVAYFVIDSVWKLLNVPSYTLRQPN